MLNKEELQDLVRNTKGKVRGVVFQTDAQYVRTKEGEEGLEKLQKRANELGLNIDYKGAKAMNWHPAGFGVASLLLMKDTFGWSDKDIRDYGNAAPKISFIVKFFFRLFISLKKLAKEVPRYWREYCSYGDLKVVKLDEKNKEMVLHLSNYKAHPVLCQFLEGYFETAMALSRESRKAKVKETKCMHRDKTPYHEFLLKWE